MNNIVTKLSEPAVKVAYISPYIPRECGIATYTKQLTNAVNILNPDHLAQIIAIDDSRGQVQFPDEVRYRVDDNDAASFREAANYINRSKIDLVHLQHEFGLYGGADGAYILEMTNRLKKPLLITFHTVLSLPTPNILNIVKVLADKASAITVLAEAAKKILIEVYAIDPDKIYKIPHGVPDFPYVSSVPYKNNLGYGDRKIISTFGLISPNKGIEYMIDAMAQIVNEYPKALFLIIGKTHPNIINRFGEKYRESLQALVDNHQLSENVLFINKYLSSEEIIYYLQATDIYVTPYLEPQQMSSGTLSYAVGAGKVCLSTPYAYAREILAGRRGYLIPFKNSKTLANRLIVLLKNDELREQLSKKSYLYGRKMVWEYVGHKHLDLFQGIKNQ
ncbi:MAG: glycosyltransferase family 4 protein [Patescibacteria group bacterium]